MLCMQHRRGTGVSSWRVPVPHGFHVDVFQCMLKEQQQLFPMCLRIWVFDSRTRHDCKQLKSRFLPGPLYELCQHVAPLES